jgi:hypothetical protein
MASRIHPGVLGKTGIDIINAAELGASMQMGPGHQPQIVSVIIIIIIIHASSCECLVFQIGNDCCHIGIETCRRIPC